MGTANTVQQDFRWRNDNGSETAATWKADTNNNPTLSASDYDTTMRIRFNLENTGGKDETDGYHFQYSINDGTWTRISQSSFFVSSRLSSYFADGDSTTQQIGGGTHDEGYMDEGGVISSFTLTQAQESENEWCFQINSGDFSGGEKLELRMAFDNGNALDGYTNTPTITSMPTPPSPTWNQANFRIRAAGTDGDQQAINANAETDWEFALNTSGTLDPSERMAGITTGIRFEIEETGSVSGTITPQLEYRLNGGTWTTITSERIDDQSAMAVGGPRAVQCFPSTSFTDGAATTNILSGSAKTFVAGSGEHSPTAAGITLNNQHTEVEWRINIQKLWNGTTTGHADGDYYDFRVTDNGTALDTYTNTPRITLNYENNHIGGTYPESIGNYGPFEASDGDLFTIVEDAELSGNPKLMRRASGSTIWAVVDNAGEPASIMDDLECFHVHQVSDTLHCFYSGGQISYVQINMSTHTWGTAETVTTDQANVNQIVSGYYRSGDSTAICIYTDATDDLKYRERSSGGVWDASATNIYTGTVYGAAAVLAASDKIYISWHDNDTTIYSISLNSSNTLGTQRTISTDPKLGGTGQWAVIQPVYWDDSGTEKVGIIYQRNTDSKLYWRIISNDGAPGTEAVVTDNVCTDNEVALNSRQAAANTFVDGTTVYVVYCGNATNRNLYYTTSANGAAFSTDTLIDSTWYYHAVGAELVNGNIGMIVEIPNDLDPGDFSGYTGGIKYLEYALAGNVVPLLQEDTVGFRLLKGATL
jgi:hypothetical protein